MNDQAQPMHHHGQHGDINWQPWSPDLFERARQEDKMVLVDVGAVWCHWCHVMDRTTYGDSRVTDLLNRDFLPVRIDRDERPDLDRFFQSAPTLIESRGNGWPLTMFLLPGGEPLFRATYLPPEGSDGTTGFLDLAEQLQKLYRGERHKVDETAEELRHRLQNATPPDLSGELSAELLDEAFHHMERAFDESWGGFYGREGSPKFPAPGAMEFLLAYGHRRRNESARRIARHTLTMMARGGIYDQLAGGFHRYSVDRQWRVPHFEKMLYDNAELLLCYLRAWRALGDDSLRDVAEDTMRFVDNVLSDREHGGFFGSQDADVGLSDDGDAFTWSLDEVRKVLGDSDEFRLFVDFYDVRETGQMHHDPRRNVLWQSMSVDDLAREANRSPDDVRGVLERARARMLEARSKRQQPAVDRTLYVSWNGMMIRAYVEAYWSLQRDDALEMARRTANRLLEEGRTEDGVFCHVAGRQQPWGLLEDQAWMALALVELYAATGESRYLAAAETAVEWSRENLWADDVGGFYDRPQPTGDEPDVLASATLRERPIEDSPSSSSNAVMALALKKLAMAADQPEYRQLAMRTLSAFGGVIGRLSVHGGALAHAAEVFLTGITRIVIVRTDGEADALVRAARTTYLPGKLLLVFRATDVKDRALIEQYGFDPDGPTAAYVCRGRSCQPPAFDADSLHHALRHG